LKAHEGDAVELRTPTGIEQLEIVEIRYGGSEGASG
jgi:transcription elongation GreA/GreB family factor